MKKCPACGSVAMDQDYTCGVCGGDLAGATTMDASSWDQPIAQAPSPDNRRLNVTALLKVIIGPSVALLGLVLAYLVLLLNLLNLGSGLEALSGLTILILGLIITIGVIGGGPSFRGYLRYRRGVGFRDKYGSKDPRPRQVEAEERQSSVEEQEEGLPDQGREEEGRFRLVPNTKSFKT